MVEEPDGGVTSDSSQDQQAEVERLIALGATRAEVAGGGAMDAERSGGVVLADPDGHEFCVLPVR